MTAAGPILVDSSVWIDFFSSKPGPAGAEHRRLIANAEPVVVAVIIVAEVLQGIRRDAAQIENCLVQWDVLEPRGIGAYLRAAALFRLARSRGVTLTTVDALIGALALHCGAKLFTLDQNFARLAAFAPLKLYQFP